MSIHLSKECFLKRQTKKSILKLFALAEKEGLLLNLLKSRVKLRDKPNL